MLNLKGEMIGLTVSLSAALGYEQAAGFAIPVDETFQRALESLEAGDARSSIGFLGVSLPLSLDPRARAASRACWWSERLEGTPAGRSLLKTGDLITHVNDRVIHDPDELLLEVGKLPPDASVRLTVERDGQVQTVLIPELSKYSVARQKDRHRAGRRPGAACASTMSRRRPTCRFWSSSVASTRKARC